MTAPGGAAPNPGGGASTSGAPELRVARTRGELDAALRELREAGRTLALVPTMGALHEGHLSLLEHAAREADVVALSVFVNPLQFGPEEDLDRYPRNLEEDMTRAARRGVGLVFAPSQEEMYPHGTAVVRVVPGPMGDRLCGRFRPGHFEGVLTVVAKLFGLFRPEVAVFGRKDFQQAVLIRRMVKDLEMGVGIRVAPLVREPDGLAMSSRNAYLTPEEREAAPLLFQGLAAADGAFSAGEQNPDILRSRVRESVARSSFLQLEYVEVVSPATLEPVEEATAGDVVALAAHLGGTRLIDNLVLGAPEPDPGGGRDSSPGKGG